MKSTAKPPPKSSSSPKRRRRRARPTPKWLRSSEGLDAVAQRRCLLVLSVLSGEVPVTDAIATAGISRPLYYQLEERALEAMLRALTPGAEQSPDAQSEALSKEVEELQLRVKRLEAEKRRSERLLLLTRKVLKHGSLTMPGRGRPRGTRQGSTTSGPRPSLTSTKPTMSPTAGASSPMMGGESEP